MNNEIYEIIIDNRKIAECYTTEDATIIIRTYFIEYFDRDEVEITVKRTIKDELGE